MNRTKKIYCPSFIHRLPTWLGIFENQESGESPQWGIFPGGIFWGTDFVFNLGGFIKKYVFANFPPTTDFYLVFF